MLSWWAFTLTLVGRQLLSGEDEAALRAPLWQLANNLQAAADILDPTVEASVSQAAATIRPATTGDRMTMDIDTT